MSKLLHASLALALLMSCAAAADTIEALSGAVIEGKVLSRDDKFVVMEVKVAGKSVQRKYGLSLIKAITIDGTREVLKETTTPGTPGTPGTKTPGTGAVTPGVGGNKSKKEIDDLINAAGKEAPDWLDSTQLNLPGTLDLAWPEKPEGGWNNQKNVGQFIWDVINPNANRWREGIKLMLHLMEKNKGNAELQDRAMGTMAGMYHHLFQDYARAAYWWRKAGTKQDLVGLAECYYRLGNKPMAVEILDKLRLVPVGAVKLWGDMGEIDKATKLVDLFGKNTGYDEAMMHAGDACRLAGRFKQAIGFYEKILALPDANENKKSKARAQASLDAIKMFDTFDLKKCADGTYKASSIGYEGPVEVTVVVSAGKIESVKVTNHKEKQYYASITDTPAQIIRKQSIKGVDATSRATITSEAIINATAKALAGGMK